MYLWLKQAFHLYVIVAVVVVVVKILRPGLAEVAQILADSSSVSHFRKKVMEGLLSHYFSSYLHDYNKDDVKWFLEQANCQTHWKTVIATRKATSIDVKDDDVVEHDVKQTVCHTYQY